MLLYYFLYSTFDFPWTGRILKMLKVLFIFKAACPNGKDSTGDTLGNFFHFIFIFGCRNSVLKCNLKMTQSDQYETF